MNTLTTPTHRPSAHPLGGNDGEIIAKIADYYADYTINVSHIARDQRDLARPLYVARIIDRKIGVVHDHVEFTDERVVIRKRVEIGSADKVVAAS